MTDKEKLEKIEHYVDLSLEACKEYFDHNESNLYDEEYLAYTAEKRTLTRIKNILSE